MKPPIEQISIAVSPPEEGPTEIALPLSEVFQSRVGRFEPSQKRQFVTELGRAVRSWHDAGDYVSDLAAIMVSRVGSGWVFLSTASRSCRRNFILNARRRRIIALGGLLADCWLSTGRVERERFLTAYSSPQQKPGSVQRRRIENFAYRKLRLRWQQRVKNCFAVNQTFVAGRQDGFRFYGYREQMPSVMETLLPDPDLVLAAGRIYKPGTRTHAGRVTVGGEYRFLKRINFRGWRYGVKYLFRRSRAVHNWYIMWAFRYRQIPVADPILCLEERFLRFLKRSYILTDFARDADRLRVVWSELLETQRKTLLVRLGNIFGRMHRFGCLHGDLKWDNILVCAHGERVVLVDFDGSRILCRPTAKKALKDVERFLKDLRQVDPTGRWERIFYNSWHKWITGL